MAALHWVAWPQPAPGARCAPAPIVHAGVAIFESGLCGSRAPLAARRRVVRRLGQADACAPHALSGFNHLCLAAVRSSRSAGAGRLASLHHSFRKAHRRANLGAQGGRSSKGARARLVCAGASPIAASAKRADSRQAFRKIKLRPPDQAGRRAGTSSA
jgi:hypothetical protein